MHLPRVLRTSGFRLTALYATVFILTLALVLGILYLTISRTLRDQVRESVQRNMDSLLAAYSTESPEDFLHEIREQSTVSAERGTVYFYADDKQHVTIGNISLTSRRVGWQALRDVTRLGPAFDGVDEDHRILALGQLLPDGSYLLVGGDAFRLVGAQESILNTFLWTAGLGILLAAIGGLFVGQRLLQQVDLITTTSRAIVSGNLKQRIPTRGTTDELDRLSANLNDMLDRIQVLMESLSHVSSNIAHDLRTPLSRLRQTLESSLAHAGTPAEYQAAIEEAIGEADTMLATFAALLRISNIESGMQRDGFRDVSLSDVFGRVAEAYGPTVEEGGRCFSAEIDPDIRMSGDFELLVQMVANLVENAIAHTPRGTAIEMRLQQHPDGTVVGMVADNGPGIPEEERGKVWDRFYRLSTSRTEPGIGLGLSLVAAVADLHHIAITLGDNWPGLRVELLFPRADAA